MRAVFVSRIRLFIATGCIAFGFLLVLGRLCWLHVWQGEKLAMAAERSRQQFSVIQARRGDILDCRGNVLATTRSVFEVGVDPWMVRPEEEPKFGKLAQLLRISPQELCEAFNTRNRKVTGKNGPEEQPIRWRKLADRVDEDLYRKVDELGIHGVYGNRRFERVYPGGSLAAHVLGYVNREGQAVSGVETCMDFYLSGQNGWRLGEKDGRRRELPFFLRQEQQALDGFTVELSIDAVVQNVIEKEVQRLVAAHRPLGVSIIVTEPSTGFILGMANYPTFDPNRFQDYDLDCLRNRAVSDIYEPGSVFKTVTVAAGLNEGIVRPGEVFDCAVDRLEYRGRLVKLPVDTHHNGRLTLEEVVMKSSNRGAVQVGLRLGEERLYSYARAFGFGEKTGFALGGEVRGIVYAPSRWDGLTVTRFPMGHAIAGTPLQTHMAMGVIASGGLLMEPQLVRRVLDRDGTPLAVFSPKVRRRVVRSDVARTTTGMLTRVISRTGTSMRASMPGFEPAGKTGSTQKILPGGGYSHHNHVTSFSGFFPATNPQLEITVVVDDPKVEGFSWAAGGVVSAPAFKNIGEQLAKHLGIMPENAHIMIACGEDTVPAGGRRRNP